MAKAFAAWLLQLPAMFVDAWLIQRGWQWFVVPLGAPPIRYWNAFGIDLLAGLLIVFPLANAYYLDIIERIPKKEDPSPIVRLATRWMTLGIVWAAMS